MRWYDNWINMVRYNFSSNFNMHFHGIVSFQQMTLSKRWKIPLTNSKNTNKNTMRKGWRNRLVYAIRFFMQISFTFDVAVVDFIATMNYLTNFCSRHQLVIHWLLIGQVQEVLEGAKVLEWLKEHAEIQYVTRWPSVRYAQPP